MARIAEMLQARSGTPVLGVGLDLAKAGIVSAAKQKREAIWCVADLAAAPFRNRSFNAILNILSPSNYAEFERLLSDDGIVLKVIPKSGYLKELRGFLYDGLDKQAYTSEDTAERFSSHFDLIDRTEIAYSKRLDQNLLPPLIKMTPLSWRAEKERINAFLKKESAVMTVHLDILAGRKKTK
ncbi:rRNA (guanine-N1)-methyltransferase [Bacillus haynesii]|uniref:rRNA (guanine-N1)-methyltransferase n=1 Tax=Bacillus haynesii TaxID=1925021 RepID=UPI00228233BA|nr:rRNA (guanine-N1)-methyltransferase [Bacillus haynesii]MCY8045479.1 rRNA (guanine-N1)-methyltransferase [Bacillus haynesii]MCY8078744.1 rRNA (guanine-N1)-methyltransferase [Bacillus haynesii]MCY8382297.1 rRNA (guanine-N1)-methyltransferase [Bacillus haynesii]MCY8589192.1 rRNA (guanine-N1)-methyltransferase [Bacillus haynesii]